MPKTKDGYEVKIGMILYRPHEWLPRPMRGLVIDIRGDDATVIIDERGAKSQFNICDVYADFGVCRIAQIENVLDGDVKFWEKHPLHIPNDIIQVSHLTVTKPSPVTHANRTCEICGTGFNGREGAKYCSPKCRKKASRLYA